MARNDYLPSSDEALRAWTANFGARISDGPEAYGLTIEQAADYAALQSGYSTKLAAAVNPLTRGNRTVFEKDEAKKTLVALTRKIARQINNLITVTDDQRQALGLTVRDTTPSNVPAPTVAPVVFAELNGDRTVKITLRQNSNLRAKPEGVADALIFTHVGPAAPTTAGAWRYAATISKTTAEITFDPSETGDTAWITAFWTNAKGQSGPRATPVSVNLPAGGALPREADEAPTMKVAA